MIVCLCVGISDREVRQSIKDGASTVEKVGLICGAGTGCGMCHETIQEIICKQKVVAQTDTRAIEQAGFVALKPAT